MPQRVENFSRVMYMSGAGEKGRLHWAVWAVMVAGFIFFALPVNPRFKLAVLVLLYVLFLLVYYNFSYKKKRGRNK